MDSSRTRLVSVVLCVCAAALLLAALTIDLGPERDGDTKTVADSGGSKTRVPQIKQPIGEARPGYEIVGGVYRPVTDVSRGSRKRDDMNNDVPNQGLSPAVKPDANEQVASVAEALKDRSHPERFSSFVKATPFDAAAYESDPSSYLDITEPGRVFQPAAPGPDVKRITPVSRRYHAVRQGESVTLAVRVAPSAPVTFTSFDLGSFENQLTSITVAADSEGVAQAPFTATPGTIDDIQILAASPLNSGQARFTVNVALPEKTP